MNRTRPLLPPSWHENSRSGRIVSQSAKTSARWWWTGTRLERVMPSLTATPPPPACLPVEHATQSLTALARTEPLLRHSRPNREKHIAARPLTRLTRKILGIRGWALALARRARLQLRCRLRLGGGHGRFPGHLLLDAAQRLLPARHPLLALPFAVTARLLPPTLLAGLTGPVGLRAPPPPPLRGLLAAGRTAKPLLRVDRLERLFTALEQALPMTGTECLSPSGRGPILRQAHGSGQLPGSSLEAEHCSPLRGVLVVTSRLVPSIPPADMRGQRAATPHAA